MTKKIVLQVESEYGEILQQAVAVIKRARVNVARQLNIGENAAYWEIGKMLHERKLDSKHGSSVVRRNMKNIMYDIATPMKKCYGA